MQFSFDNDVTDFANAILILRFPSCKMSCVILVLLATLRCLFSWNIAYFGSRAFVGTRELGVTKRSKIRFYSNFNWQAALQLLTVLLNDRRRSVTSRHTRGCWWNESNFFFKRKRKQEYTRKLIFARMRACRCACNNCYIFQAFFIVFTRITVIHLIRGLETISIHSRRSFIAKFCTRIRTFHCGL